MKKIILFLVAGFFSLYFSGCMNIETEEVEEKSTELMLNLTSDASLDAHSSMMGLNLALTAVEEGIDVTVFMNVKGVKLMLPGNDSINEPLLSVIKSIREEGGQIWACPMCMEATGVEKEMMPEYIQTSNPEMMMELIKKSPTVMTY